MVAGPFPNSSGPPNARAEYRKIQELASGGMGSVELARATSGPHAGEVVALKRLHPHLEREQHFADMFFDEAWITAGLHHPNVVQIYDWGIDSTGRYLAMEFVAGDSLLALMRDAKKRERPIPLDLALYIIGKTAEGLHAAHELRNEQGQLRHLVHRDVTPSNVLVAFDGQVKLIDFGVAKARDKLSHTSTGTIKGKFGYMSPEQARGFPIDRRSDVFSLGVVLWETLALKRLYRSESELEILRMIVDDPPTPIQSVRPDVPPEIENLLAGALAKNRDDRLGSCGEFAEFIWAIYHERGYTAGERELAAFFRAVLPERCHAIEQLLSGAHEYIDPTIVRPASGSFSGVGPRPVSGAIAVSRGPLPAIGAPPAMAMQTPAPGVVLPAPNLADGSLPATSYTSPAAEPRRANRTPVIVALAAVGVVAIAGVGWVLGHRGGPTDAHPAAVAAAPGASVATPQVDTTPHPVPAQGPEVTTAAIAPAQTAPGAPSQRPGAAGAHPIAGRHATTGSRGAVPITTASTTPTFPAPQPTVAPVAPVTPPTVRESGSHDTNTTAQTAHPEPHPSPTGSGSRSGSGSSGSNAGSGGGLSGSGSGSGFVGIDRNF